MAELSADPARRRTTLLRAALFIAVTGALTVLITAQIARISLSGGYHLTATFDDASGLTKGDQVKIAGAPVGRVDKISIVDGRARVTMTVDEGVTVPADSQAAIRWRNAIGQRVVYLLPGTSPAKLRPGAHITRTRSVVDIGELISKLAPLTRGLNAEQVNQLMMAIAQALDGNSGNVAQLIANVDRLSGTIAARRQTLTTMLADYTTITAVIARRDQQIAKATDDLVSLSDGFAGNRELLDDALVELARTMRTTDRVVGQNADQMGDMLARLQQLSSGTRRNLDTLLDLSGAVSPKLQRAFSIADKGHMVAGAFPCVALQAPPCPYPMRPPGSQEGAGRIDSSDKLRRLIVGGR